MYILLLASLLAVGAWCLHRGRTRLGATILVITVAFFGLMSFWGEMLWFDELGHGHRFWVFVTARIGAVIAGAAFAYSLGFVLASRSGPHLRRFVGLVAAGAGVLWGVLSWQTTLLYLYGVGTDVRDPMLGANTGFYLFSLPFYDSLFWLALSVAFIALLAAFFVWEEGGVIRARHLQEPQGDQRVLPIANAGFALVLALGCVLAVFHLLYSRWGVVLGPGWSDVHVRQPAYFAVAGGLLLVALLPLFKRFRLRMFAVLNRWVFVGRPAVAAITAAWLTIAAVCALVMALAPGLVQWLVVKPNEITFEKPYIAHNIAFTRRGFRLHEIEERQFSPADEITGETIDANQHLLSEVRLWDWRALDAVYKQFQEIRLYYEFVDVDIDRYNIGDRYRQVMVSARELAQRNLAPQSQTFVNRRFKYTHGYGYTLAAVSDFTPEGLPNLLVRDIPPKADAAELAVTRPEIYYGELTGDPVIVNTREEEFDYPSGESNVYTRYAGDGGVALSNLWRKFLFGWKFDGTLLLLSGYPTRESRIMFHRRVQERLSTLAPFLVFDEDPYIVAVDGGLYWIVDGYTRSTYYPYSQPFSAREQIEIREGDIGTRTASHLNGANYVRNSVKAVVNAYSGRVDLYVFDAEDPIIRTWQRALPGLFQDNSAMPPGLRAHVRYPQDFLLAQGLIFAKYHMSDPAVFYNQEDLWVRATEKHYTEIKPVEPYYVMWELPGSDRAEFVLILPFTPKNRQVLIGWIAGLSDGDNYGRFLAYKFPKEKRVLGPQQVETKIDQDSFLSGQLTLWGQQGSEVIRGNVLAIPLDDTLLYVEPIYLRAETAAYPELRLVAVMHGDNLSYAETFDAALMGLFEKGMLRDGASPASAKSAALLAKAAFESYLAALGAGEFEAAAEHLRALRDLLDELADTESED
jgi:uncharacterized membrane protein (UPF0182 family)